MGGMRPVRCRDSSGCSEVAFVLPRQPAGAPEKRSTQSASRAPSISANASNRPNLHRTERRPESQSQAGGRVAEWRHGASGMPATTALPSLTHPCSPLSPSTTLCPWQALPFPGPLPSPPLPSSLHCLVKPPQHHAGLPDPPPLRRPRVRGQEGPGAGSRRCRGAQCATWGGLASTSGRGRAAVHGPLGGSGGLDRRALHLTAVTERRRLGRRSAQAARPGSTVAPKPPP